MHRSLRFLDAGVDAGLGPLEPNFSDLAGRALLQTGGAVLGPVPDVESAMAIFGADTVDAAILGIRLGEATSLLVAKALRERGRRIVFVSGCDDRFRPDELDDVPIHRKPVEPNNLVRVLFR